MRIKARLYGEIVYIVQIFPATENYSPTGYYFNTVNKAAIISKLPYRGYTGIQIVELAYLVIEDDKSILQRLLLRIHR